MREESKLQRFEATVLPHLDAAYNLARWLTHDDSTAEDAVQEACLRAFRFFDAMHGPSPKAWFMSIVRNCCFDCLREQRRNGSPEEFDETRHGTNDERASSALESPEHAALKNAEARRVHSAIARLPVDYREVIVLRELEELTYKEISAIVKIPIGTVMSRLARGRDLLREQLGDAKQRATS